jgi:DNA repair protein RadA/Sms
VAIAIASSYRNQRIDPDLALVGEIGLSGELRSVSQLDRRVGEAARLGFRRAMTPSSGHPSEAAPAPAPATAQVSENEGEGLRLHAVRSLAEVVMMVLPRDEG